MFKKFAPNMITKYLIKEFCFSLMIFFLIFSSLIILINFIDEIFFLKEKNVIENLISKTLILCLIKTPSMLLNILPFIFLFSGIFFFIKLLKLNEVSPINFSGLSNKFIILVPAIFAFFLGLLFIMIITPVSSELTKYYEGIKRKYISNDNLIIMSKTGLWVRDKGQQNTLIIRANRIDNQNFERLENVSIYKFNNKDNKLLERIDGDYAEITGFNWVIVNAHKTTGDDNYHKKKIIYKTTINFEKLKNFYINPDTFSFWNILDELNEIKERGYLGQELKVTYNKYLSLPLFLFSMVIISTLFTIRNSSYASNFVNIFFGMFAGIVIYFFMDLSIALGKSGKIPLELSVWAPTLIILFTSVYIISNEND